MFVEGGSSFSLRKCSEVIRFVHRRVVATALALIIGAIAFSVA